MGDDYEQTLLILKECFVYRIGPRPNAAGYKAQDWDPTKFIWSGRLVIVEKGDKCTIKFEDPNNSGEIFALCPVDDTAVEPVTDSSRYFVVRIQDGSGRHAFVGMGFTERNDAFDFNTTILDHLKHVKARQEQATAVQRLQSAPKVDYSLQGTIHVELKGATGKGTSIPKQQGNLGGGGLLLPPPPKARTSVKQPAHQPQQAQQQQQQQQQQPRNDDPFALFAQTPSQPSQQPFQNQNQQFNQFQQPNQQQQQFNQFQQQPQQQQFQQQQFQQQQFQQQQNALFGYSSPSQPPPTQNKPPAQSVDWFL